MKRVFRVQTLSCLFAVLAAATLLVADTIFSPVAKMTIFSLCLVLAAGLQGWALANRRAIRETHTFIQNIIDAIPEPVYIKDEQARFRWVNEAFALERRRPAHELTELSSYDLSPNPDFSATLAAEDRSVLAGGVVFKEQHTTYPVTGEECYRLVSKRLCQDPGHRPLIIGAHFDITRMRQVEAANKLALEREIEQRRRVQTYMQRLVDVIPQPVYVKDAKSRYLLVNDAFCRHRMLTPSELIGQSPFDLSGNRQHADFVEAEDREVLAGRVVKKEECAKHPVTGLDVFRYICKGSCLDADGKPVIVGANFDITEWRMAELRWRQASAAKSEFLATMSHEIRTPLSAVIGMLQLTLKGGNLDKETHGRLSTALNSADSLLGIISDILDFSKIEGGQLQIERVDFDLPALLADLEKSFQAQADQTELDWHIEVDGSVPSYVKGDPTRLRQVLVNLVSNAFKFTERGSVTVTARAFQTTADGTKISFCVRDTGAGIPEALSHNLFQVFQQGDTSTTRRFGGTGLGLAICRQLVSAMRGVIDVTSQPGKGSCFEFSVILEPGEAPPKQETGMQETSRRLTILCAEDVHVNQLIIRAQLENLGHEVDIVANGRDAVHALSERDYDLVLMDWRMPEMDGAEATRSIRAGGLPDVLVRNRAVRIVALTANASSEDRNLALEAGMDDYLTKPVREAQLRAVLAEAARLLDAGTPPPALTTPTNSGLTLS